MKQTKDKDFLYRQYDKAIKNILSNNRDIIMDKDFKLTAGYYLKGNALIFDNLNIYYNFKEEKIALHPEIGYTILISKIYLNRIKNKELFLGKFYKHKARDFLLKDGFKESITYNLEITDKDYFIDLILNHLNQKYKEDTTSFLKILFKRNIKESQIKSNYREFLGAFDLGINPVLDRDILVLLLSRSHKELPHHYFLKNNITFKNNQYILSDLIIDLLTEEQQETLISLLED